MIFGLPPREKTPAVEDLPLRGMLGIVGGAVSRATPIYSPIRTNKRIGDVKNIPTFSRMFECLYPSIDYGQAGSPPLASGRNSCASKLALLYYWVRTNSRIQHITKKHPQGSVFGLEAFHFKFRDFLFVYFGKADGKGGRFFRLPPLLQAPLLPGRRIIRENEPQ